MAKEMTIQENGFVLPSISEGMPESVSAELEGLAINLDRIKIPSGGGLAFECPGDDPDSPDLEKEIVGIIVDHYPFNGYWPEKYNGQNVAPSCYSTDSHNGFGEPGGDCAACPYNQFGSGDDGNGKACKNAHRLYILRSGELYPVTITVPPTSLRALSDYLAKRIVTKGLRSYGVITKLTLKKAVNTTGIAYSQLQFAMLEKLPPEAVDAMAQFADSIRCITRRMDFDEAEDTAPVVVDPETGEILQPLDGAATE